MGPAARAAGPVAFAPARPEMGSCCSIFSRLSGAPATVVGMAGKGSPDLVGVVCDDRPEARHRVGRLLVRCGFQLGTAVDGFAALREQVRELQPAVAVLTLPLPGMNGLRAVRDLRADAPRCQIVLVSAFGRLDVAALEAGAAALVPEDDLQALQSVLHTIADAVPPHAVLTLPDPRAQALLPAADGVSSAPASA